MVTVVSSGYLGSPSSIYHMGTLISEPVDLCE